MSHRPMFVDPRYRAALRTHSSALVESGRLGRMGSAGRKSRGAEPLFERAFVTVASEKLGVDDVAVLVMQIGNDWVGCMPVRITRVLASP